MSKGTSTRPLVGQHVRFVRYVRHGEDWAPELVRGELEQRTDTGWRVRVVDEIRELSDSEWALYRE